MTATSPEPTQPTEWYLVRMTGGLHASRYVGFRLLLQTIPDVVDVLRLPFEVDPLDVIAERS